jgi:HSP20 family molecular chaperone IbpA
MFALGEILDALAPAPLADTAPLLRPPRRVRVFDEFEADTQPDLTLFLCAPQGKKRRLADAAPVRPNFVASTAAKAAQAAARQRVPDGAMEDEARPPACAAVKAQRQPARASRAEDSAKAMCAPPPSSPGSTDPEDDVQEVGPRDALRSEAPKATKSKRAVPRDKATFSLRSLRVEEREKDLVLCLSVPGAKKGELRVQVEERLGHPVVTVSGRRTEQSERSEGGLRSWTTQQYSFAQSVAVPEWADLEAVKAEQVGDELRVVVGRRAQTPDERKRREVPIA